MQEDKLQIKVRTEWWIACSSETRRAWFSLTHARTHASIQLADPSLTHLPGRGCIPACAAQTRPAGTETAGTSWCVCVDICLRVRGVCLRRLLNYTAILMLQLDATVCMFGKRERGLTLWECGTVLPSPRLSPPPSWLPWLRKEAPRGVDILTGWMSGRNYWSLWGARPLVSLRL